MCHAINVSQSDFTGNYLHAAIQVKARQKQSINQSINQKKWAEGISKRNLVRLYFSFRQLHITYHAKLK